MAWLFASGHAADIVLAVMLVEALWLVTRGGWTLSAVILRLGPGALMLLAVRAALVGVSWPWIALPLILSLPLHLADLARR